MQRSDLLHGAVLSPEVFLLRYLCPAGDRLLLKIKRGDETVLLGALLKNAAEFDPDDRKEFQNTLGGRLSERRGGFSGVLQHDTVLKPEHCGGPICDLDGKVVGINICRAGRVESYALTSTAVRDLLAAMKAGERSTNAVEPANSGT